MQAGSSSPCRRMADAVHLGGCASGRGSGGHSTDCGVRTCGLWWSMAWLGGLGSLVGRQGHLTVHHLPWGAWFGRAVRSLLVVVGVWGASLDVLRHVQVVGSLCITKALAGRHACGWARAPGRHVRVARAVGVRQGWSAGPSTNEETRTSYGAMVRRDEVSRAHSSSGMSGWRQDAKLLCVAAATRLRTMVAELTLKAAREG